MPMFDKRSTTKGLVITRRPGETIAINRGEIMIEVVQIKGKYVRLAFQANKAEISIQRGEVVNAGNQTLPGESSDRGRGGP